MPMILTPVAQVDTGDKEDLIVDALGDDNYPAGGYGFVVGDLPFRVGVQIDHVQGAVEGTGRTVDYDRANDKLIWREPDGTEVAGATNLSAVTARLRVLGR